MNRPTFQSKVDGWLLVVLLSTALVSLLAAAMTLISPAPGPWPLAALVTFVGCVLPVWLLVSTRYTLSDEALQVHSGPFRWTIGLGDIRDVRPTRNPLASPALSLDRLRIDYGRNRSIMISPLEKDRFLRELGQRREQCAGRESEQ